MTQTVPRTGVPVLVTGRLGAARRSGYVSVAAVDEQTKG